MDTFLLRTVQCFAAFVVIASTIACADEPSADQIAAERAARLALMQKSIGEYTLTIGPASKPVEFRKTPVLRFTNPLRSTADGGLFLWEHQGRPVALTCIYPAAENTWDHEFQSLSDLPLTATRAGRYVWTPEPAMQFKPVPKAGAPSTTTSARRREMGAISRRFSARLLGWRPGYERDDELRMQDNPVHRWGDSNGKVIDGAMFLFGEATDPEVVLIIEAHKVVDTLVWKYDIGRVTTGELVVRLDDEVIWKVLAWPRDPRPDQPYVTLYGNRAPAPD